MIDWKWFMKMKYAGKIIDKIIYFDGQSPISVFELSYQTNYRFFSHVRPADHSSLVWIRPLIDLPQSQFEWNFDLDKSGQKLSP